MSLETLALKFGQLLGHHVWLPASRFLKRRASTFQIEAYGEQHLAGLAERSFVLVSNHVPAANSEFWPWAYIPYFNQHRHSTDSFVFNRILRERHGRFLNTVALCGVSWWSPRPWRAWLQRMFSQPMARGIMQADLSYIAVEKTPGTSQRPFLYSIEAAVNRKEPILIFPGRVLSVPSGAELSKGAAHIALRHRLVIVPACIIGSEFWRKGNTVTVAFGEPFAVQRLSKEQINEQIHSRIMDVYERHKELHHDFMNGFCRASEVRNADADGDRPGLAKDKNNVASV
jgi:hypothetical protein